MSGTLNSDVTNLGAQVALSALNGTTSNLQQTQKAISTGLKVSDATDNGAAFAIAQRVRSDVGGLTAANNQLGNAQGLLSVTNTALTDISNTLNSARAVLVNLADGNTTGTQRAQYASQYAQLVSQVKTYITDSSYNGTSLIDNLGGNTITSVNLVRNEAGGTYNVATAGGSAVYTSIHAIATSAAAAEAALTATGSFINQLNSVANQLNKLGSQTNFVSNQISFNTDKINSLNTGLGALVDADLAQESAQLTSLQIQQQLGTQSLTIANQAPNTLLKLFQG